MWDDPPEVLEPRLITWLRIVGCAACVWLGLLSVPVGFFGIVLIMPDLPILVTSLLVTGAFCFWWAHALQLAPQFAGSLLVVSLSVGAVAVLLPPWLLDSRADARRTIAQRNLRNVGTEIHCYEYYGHSFSAQPHVPSLSGGEFSPTYGPSYSSISEIYPNRTTLTSGQHRSPYEP